MIKEHWKNSVKDIVVQLIADIHAQRLDEAKALLAAEDFEYVGPNMRFLSRDDMLAYQFGMVAIQKDLVLTHLELVSPMAMDLH